MAEGDGRSGLQRWLESRWYRAAPVPFWLNALAALYGGISRWRARRAQASAQRLPVPVIVVGNISVGGTGKTPVVIALVEILRSLGFHPGVISRGYGGNERGPARLPKDADPQRYGDEPVLIAQATGVPVVVARDRVAAGSHLLAHAPEVDVLVSDDGLQHYRLARDIEIAVVDGRRRHGNGRLLPAGPLREPQRRLNGVDIVLVNGPRAPDEPGFDLELVHAIPLTGGPTRALAEFSGQTVHAVAGIGEPMRYFDSLRALGLTLIEHPFPDHHRYRAQDLDFHDDRPLLMTEKDAVKCLAFARECWFSTPVRVTLPPVVTGRLQQLWER